ncbi:MAG: SDR family oxidoreductase [Deltaproteobacteria bacterium]|nr:SDR family oxidoreductase [Deltaproteobacteria bacterium]MBI3391341.1 SDR family oxidoreductase [Deltaproteobacteria bacterium]
MRAGLVETPPIPKRVFVPDLLKGQVALVTGGGTGLGRVIAQTLAEAGADLMLAARRIEVLDAAAAEIRATTGRRVETCVVNIRERAAVEALAEQAQQRFGAIDILINNAGGQFAQAARDFSPKGWSAVIETNLTGTWNMTQVFGAQMLAGQGGSIINITAVTGRGFPGIAHTGAARAGVLELTKTLAIEWGPKIRLNCVAPGPIQTEAFKQTYDPAIDKMCEGLPIPRFGTREEVAYAVVFLASPAAGFITGEVLYVAGGQQIYGRNQALFDEQFQV